MPNRFATTLTHFTLYTLYVCAHSCRQATKIHFVFNLYANPRPTRLRLPPLPNSRFCAHFYTLPYNIYNMYNFTTDVIIRDLPHRFPAADCPRHPIPRPSPPSLVSWLYYRIPTHLSEFLSAVAGRLISTHAEKLPSLRMYYTRLGYHFRS